MENDIAYLCQRCKKEPVFCRSKIDWARVCRACFDHERDWSAVAKKRAGKRDYKAEYQKRKEKNGKN